jgi:hypothetical protein
VLNSKTFLSAIPSPVPLLLLRPERLLPACGEHFNCFSERSNCWML